MNVEITEKFTFTTFFLLYFFTAFKPPNLKRSVWKVSWMSCLIYKICLFVLTVGLRWDCDHNERLTYFKCGVKVIAATGGERWCQKGTDMRRTADADIHYYISPYISYVCKPDDKDKLWVCRVSVSVHFGSKESTDFGAIFLFKNRSRWILATL